MDSTSEVKNIIRSVVGNKKFIEYEKINIDLPSDISAHNVNLEHLLKGIPSKWIFLITHGELSNAKIKFVDLHSILNNLISNRFRTPILVISDNKDFNVSDIINFFEEENVFSLNKSDYSIYKNTKGPILVRNIPIIKAISNKCKKYGFVSLSITPYEPEKPAKGWRFFARHEELKEIKHSTNNYIIIGARKIGKTSILRELEAYFRREKRAVYFLDLENCKSKEQIIAAIANKIDPKEVYREKRKSEVLSSSFLERIIQKLIRISKNEKAILLIDELGQAVINSNKDKWEIVGVLRKLAQSEHLRLIATGYYEFSKLSGDSSSPFLNLARYIKLKPLKKDELHEFIVTPLMLWGECENKEELIGFVYDNIGGHPLLLQYLCNYTFSKLITVELGTINILSIIKGLLENDKDIRKTFEQPIEQLYLNMGSVVAKYLYLKFCIENGDNFQEITLRDNWIKDKLDSIGVKTSFDERREIFFTMELRGLVFQSESNFFDYHIASPIIFKWLAKFFTPIQSIVDQYELELVEQNNIIL